MKSLDENLLKEAIIDTCMEVELRPDALERFKERLATEKIRQGVQAQRRKIVAVSVAVVASFTMLIATSPVVDSAIGSPFKNLSVKISNGYAVARLLIKPGANESPPLGNPQELPPPQVTNYANIADAQAALSFPLLSPTALPPGAESRSILVTIQELHPGQQLFATKVEMTYSLPAGSLVIKEEHRPGSNSFEIGGYSTRYWEPEVLQVRGRPGYFLKALREKPSRLMWHEEPWNITIEASLTHGEFMRIADGLR